MLGLTRRAVRVIAAAVAISVTMTGLDAANSYPASPQDLQALANVTETSTAESGQSALALNGQPQVVGKAATSVDGWKPTAEQLDGLPANLFVVNEVPLIPGVPPERLTREEMKRAQNAWESQGPALSVNVQQDEPGRVGGTGSVQISFPRRSNPGVFARNLKTTLETPAHVSVIRATGDGWNCSTTECERDTKIAPTEAPPPIRVEVKIDEKAKDGKVSVRSVARWQEQQLRNNIGGSTGIPGSFEVVGWHQKGISDSGDFEIDPPLQIRATAEARTKAVITTGAEAERRQVNLQATVDNADARPVVVKWRQLSGRSVPMLNPAEQQISADTTGQTIEFPDDLDQVTTVKFAAVAQAQGNKVQQVFTVTAIPQEIGTFNPRYKTLRKLLEPAGDSGDAAFRTFRDTDSARTEARAKATALQVAPELALDIPKKPAVRPASQNSGRSVFCGIFDKISGGWSAAATLPDGSRLALPANGSSASGNCANGSGVVNFSNASLAYGNLSFTGVVGRMTDTGFSITRANMDPPVQFKGTPFLSTLVNLPVEPLPGTEVGAALASGTWSNMTGTLALKAIQLGGRTSYGLPFLPLPEGWSVPSGSFQLAFAKETKLNLVQTFTSIDGASIKLQIPDLAGVTDKLKVTVQTSDIELRLLDGMDMKFNGSGELTLESGKAPAGKVELTMTCSAPGTCKLIDGLVIDSAKLTLDSAKGITLSASATAAIQGRQIQIQATGQYTNQSSYGLEVSVPGSVNIGGAVELKSISGKISNTPIKGGGSELRVTIGGAVTGISLGSAVSNGKITGLITNECPKNAENCTPGNLRLFLEATGNTNLPGLSGPLKVIAEWNVSTGMFTAKLGMENISIGPSQLNITSATLTLTNDPANTGTSCQPAKAPAADANSINIGLKATATVLGTQVTVDGVMLKDGYCLVGTMGTVDTGGVTVYDAMFAYSSYEAKIKPPSGSAVKLGAGKIALIGGFQLGQNVVDVMGPTFGGRAQIVLQFGTDALSFSASVEYTLAQPVYIFGGPGEQNLSLTKATLFVELKNGLPNMNIGVNANFHVPGGADPVNEPASNTGLIGRIGIKTSGLYLMLGIDTSNGPVQNAFGVRDLTIYNLAIAGSIGAGNGVSFLGDVKLPSHWTSKLMFINNPRIRLGFSIDISNPSASCVEFSIGEAGQLSNSFDLGGFGVVTARYMRFMLAPQGCQLPAGDGTFIDIPAGFAIAFDGQVMGVPVFIDAKLGMSPTGGLESIDIKANVGELALGPIKIGGSEPGTPLVLDIYYSNDSLSAIRVAIDGSITVGDPDSTGARVKVKGSFEQESSEGASSLPWSPKNFRLKLDGQADIKLLGMNLANFKVRADISGQTIMAIPLITSASVRASFQMGIKGMPFSLGGTVALVYDDGKLNQLYVSVNFSMFLIVAVFTGEVIIAFCRGTVGDLSDVDGCSPGLRHSNGDCKAGAGEYFGLWLKGSLWFYFFTISATIPIFVNGAPSGGCTDLRLLPPGQPDAPDVTAGDQAATVMVSKANYGGVATSFLVEAYNEQGNVVGNCSVPAVQVPLGCVVTGLENDKIYTFTATALNNAGDSGPSDPSAMVIPTAPPASTTPQAPFVSPGDNQLTVNPREPLSPPVSPIVSYELRAKDRNGDEVPGASCVVNAATETNCVIGTGATAGRIVNGSFYTVEARAVSQNTTTTEWSPPSNAAIPRQAPPIPNAPVVEAGNSQVQVSVTSTGSPSSYQVKVFTQDPENPGSWTIPAGSCLVQDTSDPRCVVAGLQNGVPVRALAQSVNLGELSDPSGLSAPATPKLPWGMPGVPEVAAGNEQITVDVQPAAEGSPSTYTAVTFSQQSDDMTDWSVPGGSCTVAASANPRSCTITGLSNNRRYKVRAYSDGDTSRYSLPSKAVQPQAPPGPIQAPVVDAFDRRLVAYVTKPTTGGMPSEYLIEALGPDNSIGAACVIANASEEPLACALENLTNHLGYRVRVTASNGAGSSVSPLTELIEPGTPPVTPPAPTVAVGDGAVTLTFRPANTGAIPRMYTGTAYKAGNQPVGTCTVSASALPLSCTIGSLSNSESYRFSAQASNSAGLSAQSPQTNLIRPGVPGTPVAPSVVIRGAADVVTRNPMAVATVRQSPGGTPTHTIVTAYRENGQEVGQCSVTEGAGSCTIYTLLPGQRYLFRATAVNSAGTSPPSVAAGPFQA